MKLQDFVLRAWSMSLINFWTSIPHRQCTYLELCLIGESWFMEQSTMPKHNFAFGKFCAKDINKCQQAFSRSEENWRENVLWTYFGAWLCYRYFLWSCAKIRKLMQSNIVPPPTTTKMQFEVVVQKIRINTCKRTTEASSLKFTNTAWIVDTSWGGIIH